MRHFFLGLLLIQQPAAPLSQRAGEQPKGSIQGTVLSAVTNDPVRGAVIALTRVPFVQPVPASRPITTDVRGQFTLKDVDAGAYRLEVTRDGFTRQEYGARRPGQTGTGTILTVVGNETVKDIAVHLTPAGSVNGRITNTKKEPLVGMDVSLLQLVYDSAGDRSFRIVASADTNDLGEYRLYWIAPGAYYLIAGPQVWPTSAAIATDAAGVGQKYLRTFYPGVLDSIAAVKIVVQPGMDLSAIDVPVLQTPIFRIRGRVIAAGDGNPSVTLVPRQPWPSRIVVPPPATTPKGDGTFELRDVLPGQYWIRAQVGPAAAALFPVDVFGEDVENVVLNIVPSGPIAGRVTVDGGPLPSAKTDVRLSVGFSSADARAIDSPSYPAVPLNNDGTFVQQNVAPGEYRWFVRGLPATFYIKDARFGGVDVHGGVLRILGPVSDSLTIDIGSNAGQIEGVVRDDHQDGVARASVVLVPATRRDRRDLYKSAMTDARGHFAFGSVEPGDYKLFAWEDLEPNAFFDPDVLQLSESKAKSLHIAESSKQTVDLTAILSEVRR